MSYGRSWYEGYDAGHADAMAERSGAGVGEDAVEVIADALLQADPQEGGVSSKAKAIAEALAFSGLLKEKTAS